MKISILDGYAANPGDLSWEEIKSLGECTIYNRTKPEEVIERSKDADAILINKVVINREIIEALPKLKYIGVLATGFNVVDIEAASEHVGAKRTKSRLCSSKNYKILSKNATRRCRKTRIPPVCLRAV